MARTDTPDNGSWARKKWLPLGAAAIALVIAVVAFVYTNRDETVTPEVASEAPNYVEETAIAGIEHVYAGDFEFFVGGGAAVFDCNDDGRSDLYLAGGSNPAGLYRNDSPVGGALSFSRIPHQETDLTEVLAAYPIDIDSDDYIDLAVLRLGENTVLRGLGGCRFERANETWNIDGGDQWTAAFSAKWEEGEILPTLAFGNYLEWPVDREKAAACADNALLRPDGAGYGQVTTLAPGWCTLSVLFTDWDRSGRTDLRVANDRHYYIDGSEQLWHVVSGEEPSLYTAEDGWKDIQIWGMGIASLDVTGDGYPEFFVTSQGDNRLQTLESGPDQPTYDDIAIRRGVTAHRPFVGDAILPSTAWHPEFQDVNNDGFFDLFITKGNVEAMAEYSMADPNNLLLGQPDGSFVEGAADAGVASIARSRGAAVADFNLDGMLDLVVVNRTENVQIWRNVGEGNATEPEPMGNWLAIQLSQPDYNLQAVGAWIEVVIGDFKVEYEVGIGGGHAGDQLGWIHFGLGDSSEAEIRVLWPGGEIGPWLQMAANRFVTIERGAAEPETWDPAKH